MFYKSNYYASAYYRSNYYDGTGGLLPAAETYYGKLGDLGYTGSLPDRQAAYLKAQGYTGAMNDIMRLHLRTLGYNGVVQEMIAAKSRAEGFSSPSKMWIVQGLIPVV